MNIEYLFEINCTKCKLTSYVGFELAESASVGHGLAGHSKQMQKRKSWVHCPICDETFSGSPAELNGIIVQVKP